MGKKKPLGPRNKIVANVLATFGGLERIADVCGVGRSAVCQWRDSVPYKHQQKLLEYARANGIHFGAEDFFRATTSAAENSLVVVPRKYAYWPKGNHLSS